MDSIVVGNGAEKEPEQTKEEGIQEKTLMYQILQNQLEELKERTTLLEKSFLEIESSKQAIKDLKKLTREADVFVPLGSGCYTNGSVKKGMILIDIGAGIIVKKSPVSALDFLERKKKELERAFTVLQANMNEIVNKINEIVADIQNEQS